VTFLRRALVALASACTIAVPCAASAAEPAAAPDAEVSTSETPPPAVQRWPMRARRKPAWMSARTYGYLTRPLNPSARNLDHGVLQVAAAGGTPHLYRIELALGLFDHLSLGVTAHWLPDQSRPFVSPRVAIAFYRWRWIELGALHFWSMFPPPVVDVDPATPSFQRSAQWVLATAAFSQRFLSGGVDVGAVRARELDDREDPGPNLENRSTVRWHFGGGLFLRGGTRRWGITAQAHLPQLTAEIVLDVRFGAFELRPRGGWNPREVIWSTDRRFPTRD
jgi:hypothetical protein